MDIHVAGLPAAAFIPAGSHRLYGLGVDPQDGTIYAADGIDNVQPGSVYCYKPNGSLINSFQVGVSPSDFLFVK
jgi:DNA-binding beta-propeller fold protein YncE